MQTKTIWHYSFMSHPQNSDLSFVLICSNFKSIKLSNHWTLIRIMGELNQFSIENSSRAIPNIFLCFHWKIIYFNPTLNSLRLKIQSIHRSIFLKLTVCQENVILSFLNKATICVFTKDIFIPFLFCNWIFLTFPFPSHSTCSKEKDA